MNFPALRRQKLLPLLGDEGVDVLLISNAVNVTYLTGFSGESSFLVLGKNRALLVSDARFTVQIGEECPGLEAHIRPPAQPIHNAVAEVVEKLGYRKIGFENGHLSVAELETLASLLPAASWKGGRERVEKLRLVKDSSEIAAIRAAIRIAEKAYNMFLAMIRPDDTEKDLCDNMEYYVRRAGGRCTSFPSIVAAGERAALPHAPPGGRKVGESELLLVDWGASGPFYKSDLTRVLATRTISPKLEEVYNVVLQAQEKAIRAIRPGIKAHDVDAEARNLIAEKGFGAFFGHGLGHGFGLQIHEGPAVRQNSEILLEPAMVLTVEPGIYLPGWGGVRIEDDVLVTHNGYEVLTSVAKDPVPSLGF
jgi:Xaa-Pro aminopeptidase